MIIDKLLASTIHLANVFYPSSQWLTAIGPIEQYVLADIYAWLETHSGLSHPYVTTTGTSHTARNMTFFEYKHNFSFPSSK